MNSGPAFVLHMATTRRKIISKKPPVFFRQNIQEHNRKKPIAVKTSPGHYCHFFIKLTNIPNNFDRVIC
jgi:hypothetical protein